MGIPPMTNEASPHREFDELDESFGLPAQFRDPAGVLRRQRVWIFASFVLMLMLSAVVTVVFPLKYAATATIMLNAKNIPDEFVPTTIVASIVEQFEAIQGEVFSRDKLAQIVIDTGVYAKERETTELAVLSARLGREVFVTPVSRGSQGRGAPQSVTFEVSMTGKEPKLVANVVNAIVAALIDTNIAYRSRQARVTTEFMQREFDRADASLSVHQSRLAEFRGQNRGALPEEQAAALSKLDRLEDQRRSAILRISDHEVRLARLEASPLTLSDSESRADLISRLQGARAVYTDDHPTVRSLQRQLATMDETGDSQTSSLAQSEIEQLRTIQEGISLEQLRLRQIDAEVGELDRRVDSAPRIAEQYDSLIREEQILRENYVEYLRKLKNAELALSLESAQQGAQMTRLDTALPPTSPVMERWLVGCIGVFLSIGAAAFVGAWRELVYPVVIDAQHLESVARIPHVGSISEFA
jgi:succinoglycan biosynthesis transport protein ExoP